MVESRVIAERSQGQWPAETDRPSPGGRARILDVARAAFIDRGYADVSMQEIATAAGLTKAAIYYHFKDKEALFESVIVEEIERMGAGIAARLAPGPPLRGQLERVAQFALETGRGDFGRLVDDVHRYCADGRIHAIQTHVGQLYSLIRAAFMRAREAGEIRDVDIDVALSLYLAMIGGQIKGPAARVADDVPAADMARAIADMMMRGIGTGSP